MSASSRMLLGLLAALCPAAALAAAIEEQEPNNEAEKAMPIQVGATVQGMVHFGDGRDFYRLALPRPGKLVATVAGFPAECQFQVMVIGFHKHPTTCRGWTDGEPGQSASFAFATDGGLEGCVCVTLNRRVSSISRGRWGAVKVAANGPWYTTPNVAGAQGAAPAQVDGAPVKPPIRYTLTVAYADEAAAKPAAAPAPAPPGNPVLGADAARPYLDAAAAYWRLVFDGQVDQALQLTSPDFRASVQELGAAKFVAANLKHGKGSYAPKGCERLDEATVAAAGILTFADGAEARSVMVFRGKQIDSIAGRYRSLKP